VREELVQTADRLVAELQRVLEELGAPIGEAAQAPAPEPRVLQSGRVAVDAEPFPDLASLSAFEQALSQTPGVGDVYVRSLDSGHARLEVELEHPMALAAELRGCSPIAFEVVDESETVVALRLADE